jgi:phosphoribosylglycinamide formyltransferase 1
VSPAARPPRTLAVFCSGEGTNLRAILRAISGRKLRARVAVVVSDSPGAGALKRAKQAGVPTVVVRRSDFSSREGFDKALSKEVERFEAQLIVLAGFMRVLSSWFVRKYAGRILNIHPALLPAFPGADGLQDALDHGVKVTGVTVHFVDQKVDHGPILLQEAVEIREGENRSQLLNRVHRLEHRLYPQAIQRVLDGKVKIVGRRVLKNRVKRQALGVK